MKLIVLSLALLPVVSFAQQPGGRDAFLRQQAYAEMQRVTGQVDVLQNNFDNLSLRVSRLEGRGGDDQSLRAEIAALKAAVAELRRELSNQRGEIVRDLSARIAKMQPKPEPAPRPRQVVVSGPTCTYEVRAGDTLSLVAQAFNTSVARIRELNGLKNNNLRIGQKLIVPQAK